MKIGSQCVLILLLATCSTTQAAFELRPTRLGGGSGAPFSLGEPLNERADREAGAWSIGWLHVAPHQSIDVSLDALGVSWSRGPRWGARVVRLGAPHYAEWMAQLTCRPHESVCVAVDHLRSTVDASLGDLGIRGRSTTTLSASADRQWGAMTAHVFGADLFRTGDAEMLGVTPSIGGRASLQLAGFELAHRRSWRISTIPDSETSFEISWRGHPGFEIGQSWGDQGASMGNWLRLQFDRAGVCVWRTLLESGSSSAGFAISFRHSPDHPRNHTNQEVAPMESASRRDHRRIYGDAEPRARLSSASRRSLFTSPARILSALPHAGDRERAPATSESIELDGIRNERHESQQSEGWLMSSTPWERDPVAGESWSTAWADSLWSVQDSLEARALEGTNDESRRHERSIDVSGRVDSSATASEPAAASGIPIPLREVRGDDVARLLALETSRADSLASRVRAATSLSELSIGRPEDPMRDLAPYLTAVLPAPDPSRLLLREDPRRWSIALERTLTPTSRSSRLQAEARYRNVEVEARARRSDTTPGWRSVRLGSPNWTVMGGDGFGLPAPRDLWHQSARPRRAEGRAAWLETSFGPFGALASASAEDASFELSLRRPRWNLALARLPRDLGGAQLLLCGGGRESEWTLSIVRISETHLRSGARIRREQAWNDFDFRAEGRWDESVRRNDARASRLSAPAALRFRRELLTSATSRRLSADLAMEWRARATALQPGAASDETRRWRFGARARRFGARFEIRLARSHTDAQGRSETPFVAGTRTRDIRGTGRLAVQRDSGAPVRPGIEIGIEQRATNSGSWSGRWGGAWLEGRDRSFDWGIGLLEVSPAPERTIGVAPRWTGGRRISVATHSLLFGLRVRRNARFLRCDFKAVGPLSPLAPPRFELTLAVKADSETIPP